MHHQRDIQSTHGFPYRIQRLAVRLQAVEVGTTDAHPLGAEFGDSTPDLVRGFGWIRQIGVCPEAEVRRIDGAVDRHLVVADPGVLVAEITRPVHEGVGRSRQHQLIDATLGHELSTGIVGHAGEQVALGFGIGRRLAWLAAAQVEMAHREALGLHERSPEVMAVEHAFGDDVGVEVDQHAVVPVQAVQG